MVKSHTRDDHPEMIRIANPAATPARYRDGAVHWHSDSSYEPVPASITIPAGAASALLRVRPASGLREDENLEGGLGAVALRHGRGAHKRVGRDGLDADLRHAGHDVVFRQLDGQHFAAALLDLETETVD